MRLWENRSLMKKKALFVSWILIRPKGAFYPQVLDLLPERIAVDAEQVRGAHLVALGLSEHERDEVLLESC